MKKKRNKNKKLMRETEATRETMRENKNESRNKRKDCVHKVSHSVVSNSL